MSDATEYVGASFNDSRCNGGMVCPNDPLFFTCIVTYTNSELIVTLPSGEDVTLQGDSLLGEENLPGGITVYDHYAGVTGGSGRTCYRLILAIDRASLLNDSAIECNDSSPVPVTDEAACPVASKTMYLPCFHCCASVLYYGVKNMLLSSSLYRSSRPSTWSESRCVSQHSDVGVAVSITHWRHWNIHHQLHCHC